MPKTIRWGIIGCGAVTEKKSGPAFQKARNSALVAVMRRTAEKAADYARRHQVPRWYSDAEKLIEDPEVDAVYIATPPSDHKYYTLRVAQAGKPVYVEKPMARNYPECQEMIAACREGGVPLFVAYYRRALPRFQKIKELVETGAIGQVRFVHICFYRPPYPEDYDAENRPWRTVPEIAGGGRFVDMASHTLDILDFILGPIREVQGDAANQAGLYKAEDLVSCRFTFEAGYHGTGIWCFSSFRDVDFNEIVGEKGCIQFSTFGESPIILKTATQTENFSIKNPTHIQQPLIQSIVDELNGEGQCPSTGLTAARTNWVMDEILKSYYQS
ncbi:MAG: Gfo/Idh/MocA family oxidoreductase [Calditrichia bacterium]